MHTETSQSAPIFSMSSTATPRTSQPILDSARDILLWRRKKATLTVVSVATATWVAMELYQFSFITILSWVAMAVVTSLFLWGSICRLLGKEPPTMSGPETTELSTAQMTNFLREVMEEAVRWIFRVGAESEWHVCGGVVAGLWLLSLLGSCMDLLTLVYIGIMVGATIPVMYVRYEDKIKRYGERVKVHCRRVAEMVDEKVFKNVKKRIFKVQKGNEIEKKEKEKKAE